MELLGTEMGEYTNAGQGWDSAFNDWFDDPRYSLNIHGSTKEQKEALDHIEMIALETGARNLNQALMFRGLMCRNYSLEKQVDGLEARIKMLEAWLGVS
jgi:hypothetical protein